MRKLTIAFLLAAVIASAQKPESTITDAQRIKYLAATNAMLNHQMNSLSTQLTILQGASQEQKELAKVVEEIKASCPSARLDSVLGVICSSTPVQQPVSTASPAPEAPKK